MDKSGVFVSHAMHLHWILHEQILPYVISGLERKTEKILQAMRPNAILTLNDPRPAPGRSKTILVNFEYMPNHAGNFS